jgi:hypothetical protein
VRFLLLEAEPATTSNNKVETKDDRSEAVLNSFYKEWKTADKMRREVILREILQRMGSDSQTRKRLLQLVDPFRTSCYKYGIKSIENPFMEYFEELAEVKDLKFDKQQVSNINTLVMMSESDMFLRNRVQQTGRGKKSYLLNPTLFYRNGKDFAYTVQIIENVLEPSKLSKYFKDIKDISIDQLIDGDEVKGKIKPAGNESTADDINTIYGQVEAWAGENGENDAADDVNLSTDGKKSTQPQKSESDKPKTGKLTQRELNRIKLSKDRHFTSIEAAEKAGVKDGPVVYIHFNKDMAQGAMNDDNWVDAYMVRHRGKWQKYEV